MTIQVQRIQSQGVQAQMMPVSGGGIANKRISNNLALQGLAQAVQGVNQITKAGASIYKTKQHYDEKQAELDAGTMDDPTLAKATAINDLSSGYRTGLQNIYQHRSLMDIQQQLQQQKDELVSESLNPQEIRDKLTKTGTDLMNNNAVLKTMNPVEVGAKFYEPLLSSIDRLTEDYSQQVATNLKQKTFEGLGAATEQKLNLTRSDKSLSTEQKQATYIESLNNQVNQTINADFSPVQANHKVMQTTLTSAIAHNDVGLLNALDHVQLEGKTVSTMPENVMQISNAREQINNNIKAQHDQYLASLKDRKSTRLNSSH